MDWKYAFERGGINPFTALIESGVRTASGDNIIISLNALLTLADELDSHIKNDDDAGS